MPLQPGAVDDLFRDGRQVAVAGGGQGTVEVCELGNLRLPTGRLVAADLWQLETATAFATQLPPGAYPVEISRARSQSAPASRPLVLAVRVRVRQEPAASWAMAVRPGEDPRTLGNGEFFGFDVEAGTACLVDAQAKDAAAAAVGDDFALFQQIQQQTAVVLDIPAANANVIAFASGLGDGYHPVWIGRAADGGVVSVVVDLLAVASD